MSDFLKCVCPHCGQSIEYPAEGTGQTVPCPTCQKPFVLIPAYPPASSGSIANSTTPVQGESKARKSAIKKLSALTAETIRVKSSAGNTPLHLAAKNGHIDLIPSHLLSEELFMDRNREGNTPLHIAAMHGNFFQVPRQFLTERTVTIPNSTWTTGSGYKAHGPTALYAAAVSGYVDQIPREFFIPEFLLIETTGYKQTLLQFLVKNKRLDLLPEYYASSELWNRRNVSGLTPLEILEHLMEQETQFEIMKAEQEQRDRERAAWRPPRFAGPTQTDPSKLLPIFFDESLRSIQIQSSDLTKIYMVNLFDYTCTCPLCIEVHSVVPPRDFGRLCKHIILALRRYNLVRNLPAIARAIAENGSPDAAFGVYPGRFATDLNGNPIYITGKNYDGWLNVFALWRRGGVNYYRFGFNVRTRGWTFKNREGVNSYRIISCDNRMWTAKPNVDETTLY